MYAIKNFNITQNILKVTYLNLKEFNLLSSTSIQYTSYTYIYKRNINMLTTENDSLLISNQHLLLNNN